MNEHPYQLRRIELRDFKSVAQASVDLRPLTVVVGANSSGKSTLLQSILAVAQAVRSGTSTAEFPLNGEFVRLGTFEETKNFLAESDAPLQVGFDLADTQGWLSPRRHRDGAKPPARTLYTWRAYMDGSIKADHVGGAAGFARLLSLEIELNSLPITDSEQPERMASCDLRSFGAELTDITPSLMSSSRIGLMLTRGRRIAVDGRLVDWGSGNSSPVHAVILSGGLPVALLRRQSRIDVLAELWWSTASKLFDANLEEERLKARQGQAPARRSNTSIEQAQIDLEVLLTGAIREDEEASLNFDRDMPEFHFLRRLGSLAARRRTAVARSMVSLGEAEFRKRLRRRLVSAAFIDEEVLVANQGPAGEELWEFAFASQRFFHNSVRYLGPLREAPHVLYDPGPSKVDLGVRGEYSAAVLHAQSRSTVLMPTPEGDGEMRPLSEALDFWLREFGLAEKARSADRGRIGIGLSVTPEGIGREVDLTSVGVGVSQVLPVILLCLLAEPSTLVILEQPELHLHPKLQQELADFLIACARSGRQLVIETHSEHLVNRLRYQIAKDEGDDTHGLIRFIFAEYRGGITSYREPAINAYGGLGDDWPTGFLDLTVKESQELVRQSVAKRRRATETRDP